MHTYIHKRTKKIPNKATGHRIVNLTLRSWLVRVTRMFRPNFERDLVEEESCGEFVLVWCVCMCVRVYVSVCVCCVCVTCTYSAVDMNPSIRTYTYSYKCCSCWTLFWHWKMKRFSKFPYRNRQTDNEWAWGRPRLLFVQCPGWGFTLLVWSPNKISSMQCLQSM